MKMIKFLFSIVFVLLFTACVPSYNIEPEYENKTLVFDNLKIENMIHTKDKGVFEENVIDGKKFFVSDNKSLTYDGICQEIVVGKIKNKENPLNFDYIEFLKRGVTQGYLVYCKYTKISNITFSSCKIFSPYNENLFEYSMTSSKLNKYGRAEENITVWMKNEKCYNKFLDYYKNLAKQDGVEIKESYF